MRTEKILGSRLPTHRQVITNYRHFLLTDRKSKKEAALEVGEKVIEKWGKLPIIHKCDVIKKINKDVDLYNDLCKRKDRPSNEKREKFILLLDQCLDISHRDAVDIISKRTDDPDKKEED